MMQTKIFITGGLLLLSGCATPLMTEEACLAGAWEQAGYEDGAAGKRVDVFEERAALCNEVGARPDDISLVDYRKGRDDGLSGLCTHRGGYEFGLAGKTYEGVCPAEIEGEFLAGYFPGRRIEAAQSRYSSAQSAYSSAISSLESVRAGIDRARTKLADPDAKEKAIRRAEKTLKNADRDLRNARQNITAAEVSLDTAEEELDYVRASSASWGESGEFYALYDVRTEVENFSRGSEAIDYCTERSGYEDLVCYLDDEKILVSGDGRLCAAGPGEARFKARGLVYNEGEVTGFRHAYDIHPLDERGRPSRRAAGFFEAFFDAEGGFLRVGCAPAVIAE